MKPFCARCSTRYVDFGFDLNVPDDVWRKIGPNGDESGLLCPHCILFFLQGELDIPLVINGNANNLYRRVQVAEERVGAPAWRMNPLYCAPIENPLVSVVDGLTQKLKKDRDGFDMTLHQRDVVIGRQNHDIYLLESEVRRLKGGV